jgi:predicted  nucleic acid-binding Zn-ribbon protein
VDRACWKEVVKAPNSEQLALLDVQAHDTKLAQLQHRLTSLPQTAELADVRDRLARLRKEVIAAETIVSDLEREQLKADADVDVVRERSRKDRELLDSGSITDSKQLQSLESELQSLAARQTALEDVELEVMERLEGAKAAVVQLSSQVETTQAREQELATELAGLETEIGHDRETVTAERGRVASLVSAELLALYDKIRADHAGVGAARFHRGRCEGCRLELPPTEIASLKAAAEDEVLRCEECRCILIRTAESGL